MFRRDQIWFIEKDRKEQSKLYSLADFKTDSVRKNESFKQIEKNMLKILSIVISGVF